MKFDLTSFNLLSNSLFSIASWSWSKAINFPVEFRLLKISLKYDSPIEAPIKKDEIIGKLKVVYDDEKKQYERCLNFKQDGSFMKIKDTFFENYSINNLIYNTETYNLKTNLFDLFLSYRTSFLRKLKIKKLTENDWYWY